MSGPTQDHGEQSKALPTLEVEEAPAISHSGARFGAAGGTSRSSDIQPSKNLAE